jgi:hypothetical protein
MPAEILTHIADFLVGNKSTLASLALVNSDCRQLARTCQFAEILFDYSPAALDLFMSLERESSERRASPNGITTAPTIGACVRRVTFAPDQMNIVNFHQNYRESRRGPQANTSSEYVGQAFQEDIEHYSKIRGTVAQAVQSAMPNLETLIWEDGRPLDREFFELVARSSVRHVKFRTLSLGGLWRLEPPLMPDAWPLQSLDIETSVEDVSIQEFFESLLRLCAPTLESLRFRYMGSGLREAFFGQGDLRFPKLRSLRLDCAPNPTRFSSLLASPLKVLEVPPYGLDVSGQCLTDCEVLRDLETLVIPVCPRQPRIRQQITTFLMRHRHIKKLAMRHRSKHLTSYKKNNPPADPISVLADGGFDNLTSLSLAWVDENMDHDHPWMNSVIIPETALAAIGSITSLEQLYLAAGMWAGVYQHQWHVDHTQLQHHLQSLNKLKLLALTHDTYPCSPGVPPEVTYYARQYVGRQEWKDAKSLADLPTLAYMQYYEDENTVGYDDGGNGRHRHFRVPYIIRFRVWEQCHRNRMLKLAEGYAKTLPSLEWLLCGQRPIAFPRDYVGQTLRLARPMPLTDGRDDCVTFLEKIFGIN